VGQLVVVAGGMVHVSLGVLVMVGTIYDNESALVHVNGAGAATFTGAGVSVIVGGWTV